MQEPPGLVYFIRRQRTHISLLPFVQRNPNSEVHRVPSDWHSLALPDQKLGAYHGKPEVPSPVSLPTPGLRARPGEFELLRCEARPKRLRRHRK